MASGCPIKRRHHGRLPHAIDSKGRGQGGRLEKKVDPSERLIGALRPVRFQSRAIKRSQLLECSSRFLFHSRSVIISGPSGETVGPEQEHDVRPLLHCTAAKGTRKNCPLFREFHSPSVRCNEILLLRMSHH